MEDKQCQAPKGQYNHCQAEDITKGPHKTGLQTATYGSVEYPTAGHWSLQVMTRPSVLTMSLQTLMAYFSALVATVPYYKTTPYYRQGCPRRAEAQRLALRLAPQAERSASAPRV